MSLASFKKSLDGDTPLPGLTVPLQALWWAGKGEWDKAHDLAQSESTPDTAWVHAYLHRVEGDDANAGYWYRQAGRSFCAEGLQAEWSELVTALL